MPAPNWKPGQSGNPKGRPKGYADFSKRCREWADKYGFDYIKDLAAGSDSKIKLDATKFLIERGYGKSTERIEHSLLTLEQMISKVNNKDGE